MRPYPIIDYYIVIEEMLIRLENSVRSLLKEGWYPLGGVIRDDNNRYLQTMVKYA